MSATSNLYLLRFHGQPFFKIGKADDVHVRIAALRATWGEVDLANSHQLELPAKDVLRVERALHLLLCRYRTEHIEGDGHTELFKVEALQLALDHLMLVASAPACASEAARSIKRCISLPPPPEPRTRLKAGVEALALQQYNYANELDEIERSMRRLTQLLQLLHRRQARIPYEFSFDAGDVLFRVSERFVDRLSSKGTLQDLLTFSLGRAGCWTLCRNELRRDGVVQFRVEIPSRRGQDGVLNQLVQHLAEIPIAILMQIPRRSQAAKDGLAALELTRWPWDSGDRPWIARQRE